MYLGLPNAAQAGTRYLATADVTNVNGFMGDGNSRVTGLRAKLTVNGKKREIVFGDAHSQDVPVIIYLLKPINTQSHITALYALLLPKLTTIIFKLEFSFSRSVAR